MSTAGKVCPNCQTALHHPSTTFELYRRPTSKGDSNLAPLPVLAYLCSQCGYIQLHASRVAGSLYGNLGLPPGLPVPY